MERIRAKCHRGLVKTLVDLGHRRHAGPNANRHVPENKADNKNDSSASNLNWWDIEGKNIAHPYDRPRNGEAQHRTEFKSILSREIMSCQQISRYQPNGRRQRGRDRGDHKGRAEGVPCGPRPSDALFIESYGKGCDVMLYGQVVVQSPHFDKAAVYNDAIDHQREASPTKPDRHHRA